MADGLADPDVYILDPCCGTGGFLVATLAHIAETLAANGEEGLLAAKLKQAATQRIFGFEILPAPLVIAHMQIGLVLSRRGAPLAEDERAGVYLTNALTGWEPPDPQKERAFQQILIPFPELAHERARPARSSITAKFWWCWATRPTTALPASARRRKAGWWNRTRSG